MQTQLYIPKKIKVGYQKRSDTYTNKLAYIIYYDDKNVLRKEKSWNSWRDKKIEPDDFDNAPQSGIIINKNVSRYNWSHFSSNRTYIRLHDPRGFEFEISPENLIGILMNGDCSKRVLDGEFVYSWSGTDLVLLPCNSEEYQKSLEFTKLQANKIGVKDLIPGFAYGTKREKDVIYMGRFNWYRFDSLKGENYKNNGWVRNTCITQYKQTDKKYHIFKIGDSMVPKTSLDFLSHKLGDEPVANYAKLMDELNKNIHISPMIGIEYEETVYVPKFNSSGSNRYIKNSYFNVENDDGSFSTLNITAHQEYVGNRWTVHDDKFVLNRGYNNDRGIYFDLKTNILSDKYTSGGYNSSPVMTLEDINKKYKIRRIFAKMQNGKRVELVTAQAHSILNMH